MTHIIHSMKLLGIDYGRSKAGLAISGGSLAAPLSVIRSTSQRELAYKILKVIKEENITGIVIGISENESEKDSREFAKELSKITDLEIYFEDETLSTQDANLYAIEAGIGRKKRKEKEDAYAATIILQRYLDNN